MPKTLMVVEDNDLDLLMLQHALENVEAPFHVQAFFDGEQVRNFIGSLVDRDSRPGLILLDLNVPKIDGMTLLEDIRQNRVLRDVPVVIWSSARAPKDVAHAKELGVTEFLVKSPNLKDWNELGRKLCAMAEIGNA